MFVLVCLMLMLGYPVAFTLGGTALIAAAIGILAGHFDPAFLNALPNRLFGIMDNTTLTAVPLFVLMGVMLQRSRVAEALLEAMGALFGQRRGGLSISVILVGALLAASTGIVGATVVTMGLMSLPTMLKRGYEPAVACGTICATGTLGQIIPPSIALVLLGDVLSSSYQEAQLALGNFTPDTVSVGDLFVGALIPGLILVLLYMLYIAGYARWRPASMPPLSTADESPTIWRAILPPLLLILAVLGSILSGAATPTEAAGVGALGATLIAVVKGELTRERLFQVGLDSMQTSAMVFMILIGAALFSLVFRGFGGDVLIRHLFEQLPGGALSATLVVMLVIFLLGFILDFIEITFVVVPIVGPILLAMGVDPVWLGIVIAINLQTSFLTPPFGFALFYLRGVAPDSVKSADIYRGVVPFILLQLTLILLLFAWPGLATWLPSLVYG
jgi:tripartite ATP-independent transporter DctM subunit